MPIIEKECKCGRRYHTPYADSYSCNFCKLDYKIKKLQEEKQFLLYLEAKDQENKDIGLEVNPL